MALPGTTTTFPPDILTLYAPTVVVAWQNSDLARWKAASPTSTSMAPLDPSIVPRAGLSTGAKVGIGIGCALVAIAAGAIVLLLIRNRSRKRRLTGNDLSFTPVNKPLPVKDNNSHVELADEVALQEMAGYERQTQADNVHARAELM